MGWMMTKIQLINGDSSGTGTLSRAHGGNSTGARVEPTVSRRLGSIDDQQLPPQGRVLWDVPGKASPKL